MALPAAAIIEVRTTGADNNGGGFNAARGGVDYSRQDSPQATGTATSSGTTLTATTGIFTADMVGNYITNGTAWREITGYTSATVVTLDASPAWTSQAVRIGGAILTLGRALSSVVIVAGNTVYVKSGTYTITATVTPGVSGTTGLPITVIGYDATRGDRAARPLLTSATNSVNLVTTNNHDIWTWININFSHTAGTRGNGILASAGDSYAWTFQECMFDGCLNAINGDYVSNYSFYALTMVSVEIKNSTAHGILNAAGVSLTNCWIHDCATNGLDSGNATPLGLYPFILDHCVVSDCTRGVSFTGGGFRPLLVSNSAIVGNSGDGVYVSRTIISLSLVNNVIYGNGGWGVSLSEQPSSAVVRANAFGANTSGARNNLSAGTGDVTLSADPFTNSGAGDYSLNATAGGGAACRSAGFPGATPWGGVGYADIGALQHQGSGGGTSSYHGAMSGGLLS